MALAKLALEDGTVYTGRAFGAAGEMAGEVVFNTSMTGYQEVLTDPSYRGQIVTMTYPLIGNYGTTAADAESKAVQVSGFVVRELTRVPSNFRSDTDLDTFLKKANVIGIEGVDTRALVRRLRSRGSMPGVLSNIDLNDASLVAKAKAHGSMAGKDYVKEVVPAGAFTWNQGFDSLSKHVIPERPADRHVVAIDYGMKWNILRCLTQVGCKVTVLPGTCTADEVLAHNPDGVFLSNGPGDPAALDYAVSTVKGLLGKKPVFGICLGHQLLGRALGADTFKLKFGHRGANQPVLNKLTGAVEITTQNHGFAVDPNTLPPDVEVTHVNLNDGTCEGLASTRLSAFGVQYHPEAAAGPHDSTYLFEQFRRMLT
ncbi:MAG: glutamine-hydrolyzing carbamoyl-phosphate synthase small subunit [Fimbriiglobus sp.]|jgi:carbamoyl-phosphate synthase small subunit|nr:glutamine-hydrolyzing carbamoyl-phosphate synthase small subunit [Fimbriiglobus sp.]